MPFLLLLLIPGFTRAEDSGNYCTSLVTLVKNTKGCGDNAYFAKAGQVCLGKIEKDLETKKALLSAAMASRGNATAAAQAGKIENNSKNISELRASIEALTSDAVQARKEIAAYADNFQYAGGISRSLADKLGISKTLQKFSCFKRNREALVQVVQILSGHIDEFHQIVASAREIEAKDSVNLKKISSNSLTGRVSGRSPASSGGPDSTPPPPVAKKGPSSITGTEKIGENERALQRKLQQ